MSTLTPCSAMSLLPRAFQGRMFLAPVIGAVLALGIVAGTSWAAPFFAQENTHFPPERLAEIERMMAGE